MTYRTSHIALATLALIWVTGCLGEPSSDEVEAEIDSLVEGHPPTITFRDCTCDETVATATSYSDRFDDWPDYDECLDKNRQAALHLADRASQGRALMFEYLDPRPDGRPIRRYWHHDTRRGTFYHYLPCTEVAADEPCGWRSRDFDEFIVSTRAREFPGCTGDDTIDSATVTIGFEGGRPQTLPASLLEETESE